MKNLRQNSPSLRIATASKCALFLTLGIAALGQTAFAKAVGTVKSISGNSVVLMTETGEVTVTLADSTRIVSATPGQTDLKNATPIQVSDIHVGDRMLAIGPSAEGNSVAATTVIVMKQSDIADKHQQEREEWRKGADGIVKEVNRAAGTITISNALASSGKPIVIHFSPATSVLRYSPDSINFDDAKPGTLDQIKPGDQLRARGTKNDDGSELTAQAIISGMFRNIAGTVISTDAANSSIIVMDLATKHPVTLKISTDSQMHKLPPFVAKRIAARLKGDASGANSRPDAAAGESSQNGAGGSSNRGEGQKGQGNWRRQGGSGGPPDFEQMLSRAPSIAISDLQKGDAVILLATEGSPSSAPTARKLFFGVEPILAAVPGGAVAATILSPWNLGSSPGGGDAAAE